MSRSFSFVLMFLAIVVMVSSYALAATFERTASDIAAAGITLSTSTGLTIFCRWPVDGFHLPTGSHTGRLTELCGGTNLRASAYTVVVNGNVSDVSGELYLDTDLDITTGMSVPQFSLGADYKVVFNSTSAHIIRLRDNVDKGEAIVLVYGQKIIIAWDNALTDNLGAGLARYGVILSSGEYAPDNMQPGYVESSAPGRLTVPSSGLINREGVAMSSGPGVLSPLSFRANLFLNVGDVDDNPASPVVKEFRFVVDGRDLTTSLTQSSANALLGAEGTGWFSMANWGRAYDFSIALSPGFHDVTFIAVTDRGVLADSARWFVQGAYYLAPGVNASSRSLLFQMFRPAGQTRIRIDQ